mgnify:CR=1 FL=1
MSFKPIYWFHDNIKFSSKEITDFKSNIDKIGAEKYTEDNLCITTFVYCKDDRPDLKYNDMYSKIVENITKKVGIFNNILYDYTYWTQMYENNMRHKPHNHAKLDPKFVDIISWVHFIDVPEQKCFRFLDNDGNFFVPDEQNNGDIICFPSWAWHEVIPNETEHRRLVISGNISVTHFDS